MHIEHQLPGRFEDTHEGVHADDKGADIFVKQMSRAVKGSLLLLLLLLLLLCVFCVLSQHWDLLRGGRSEVFDVEIDERLEEAGKRAERL